MNYKNKTLKVGTFFSGIGSPEKAIQKLKEEKIIKDYEIMFFSEIDKSAIKSYCEIHNVDEKLNLGNISNIKGNDLPYCDIWIGGFPCQDISLAGKQRGFDKNTSTRSSLGWEMIRLLNEVKIKPKYIVFENVSAICSKKFENTLKEFKNDLIKLGYKLYDKLLNAIDYGIPQTRIRYFLVALLDQNEDFCFPNGNKNNLRLVDMLEKYIDEEYYLTNNEYQVLDDNTILFKDKKRYNAEYEIYLDKYYKGGICGEDKHSKFHQSSRIYSQYGYSPTLTANNTTNNAKIIVED